MHQLDKLKAQRKEIYRIARKHRARKLYVFGSCARREETPESDIDFLVEYNPHTSLLDHIKLQDDLEQFLQTQVDLVSKNGIHRYIKDQVEKEAVEL
jgi:uncharacterized protein